MEGDDDPEVQSPLKIPHGSKDMDQGSDHDRARKKLDLSIYDTRNPTRKQKSKPSRQALQNLELNELVGLNAIIPFGLMNSRMGQLDTRLESSGGLPEENLKKQRRGSLTNNV